MNSSRPHTTTLAAVYNRGRMVATIQVNGDVRPLTRGETIRTLLTSFNLKPEKVAIEVNRRLIRAGDYDRDLIEGDIVEIVTFVGGG